MTYSELSHDEREFLDHIKEAEKSDSAAYIAQMSIIFCQKRPDSVLFMAGYSNGALKRAIKRIRELQAYYPQYESVWENAALFIRRKLLHRKKFTQMYRKLTSENQGKLNTKINELLEQQNKAVDTLQEGEPVGDSLVHGGAGGGGLYKISENI